MQNNKKHKAISLRLLGESYNVISRKLGIPKSTLSFWFQGNFFDIIKKENYTRVQQKWAQNITVYNKKRALLIQNARKKKQEFFSKKVEKISQKELFLIGTSLYWAEGYKVAHS